MKKIVILCALAAMYLSTLALAQAQSVQYGPIAFGPITATTTLSEPLYPGQVDTLGITVSGLNTAASWTVQVQTSPDNSTWSNCGSAVTIAENATVTATCTPQGGTYVQLVITAGSGGGSIKGAIFGLNTKIGSNGGGGSFTPAGDLGGSSTSQTVLGLTHVTNAAIPVAVTAPSFAGALNGTVGATTPAAGSFTTLSASAGITSTSDGVHAGYNSLVGNTTAPAVVSNTAGFIGPNSASFTAYALQLPSANPAGAEHLICGAPGSSVSTCTWSASGVATLVAGTVTVSNAAACSPSSTCVYKLTRCGLNSSPALGFPSVGTVTGGTSFVINSESAVAAVVTTDVSSICWEIN